MIENGFKEEEKRALIDYKTNDNKHSKELAFLAYKSKVYQVRMYGVFLFGYLSKQDDILIFMRDEVSKDDNWRVQEVLAKAFDEFCKKTGYEEALPIIDEWLGNDNPNTRRAVTEGLRIWTSRPYFKENPKEAIRRIANLKEDTSEYVRKSVGNALRDISKKFPELIKLELDSWHLENKEIKQVYKLASKFIV
ncbi:MAG: DNA alkylation repair protein [Negativicoccus succinicivorans]|uniref:DNA alkylation repair protein n=1 Tax=Negativicoccus succinicivorans TaxID=620903 RepID=UPI00079858DC|nr:DNA alkylation repair protein [Negativicoccus succinicivorans]KWZ86238.1 HEAT repeat protein [Anaerococcus hydrogenalis]MDU5915594.1 DNA alkylation repair protein [Negativicoccus succinicivorans]